jgi:hypothetical protein
VPERPSSILYEYLPPREPRGAGKAYAKPLGGALWVARELSAMATSSFYCTFQGRLGTPVFSLCTTVWHSLTASLDFNTSLSAIVSLLYKVLPSTLEFGLLTSRHMHKIHIQQIEKQT